MGFLRVTNEAALTFCSIKAKSLQSFFIVAAAIEDILFFSTCDPSPFFDKRMTSFRPSNPVARSLIKLKPISSDHDTKRSRAANHSGLTLPKVKPYPTVTLNNNKVVPNNKVPNNKANQFEHSLAGSPLIPSPRKIVDCTYVSAVPKLSLGPQIAPVEFITNSSRFRPIRKQLFCRVYPLCQKRKHDMLEVPETDDYSDDEVTSYIDAEPEYVRARRQSYHTEYGEFGRSSSHAELGREISMSPLARIISAMPPENTHCGGRRI